MEKGKSIRLDGQELTLEEMIEIWEGFTESSFQQEEASTNEKDTASIKESK